MAQWKNTDAAANSVFWAAAQFKTPANTANRDAIFGNTTANAFMSGIKAGVFAADNAETAAESAITHAGWVLRTEGTGGRAGRVQYETLVAMNSFTNDAEDTVLKDVKIWFTLQPLSQTVDAGDPAEFTVAVDSVPDGATVTYVWQANTGSGFANLAADATYSDVDTATLTIADSTGLDGAQYRVLALSAGANTITSNAAILTVTA